MTTMVKGIIGGDEFTTEILVRGLTVHGPADAYYVGHCADQLGARLAAKCKVHNFKSSIDFIPSSAILFLAFKPSEADQLLPKIAAKVQNWTLIVSAVRGLKLATLEYFFPNNEIVRLVINPSVISGAGLGAYALSHNASADARSMAQIVLKDCGDVIAVQNEDELEKIKDFLTANTYFSYLVVKMMMKNAKKIGMNQKEASFAVSRLLGGSIHTLIDEAYDTSDVISRSLADKEVAEEAKELIRNYGINEELMIAFNKPEVGPAINPADDPKNYTMHYRWSG